MSEQPGRYERSPSGLIGAMLVLLAVIAVFVGVRALRGNQDVPPPAVEYAGLAEAAQQAGKLVAPAPDPLPGGWRVTSARYQGTGNEPTWHLGILTPKQTYVAVEEQKQRPGELVADFLGKGADQLGPVRVGGVEWTGWSLGGDYALTTETPRSTVYVGGPAGKRAVVDLAESLGDVPTAPGG